MKILVVDDNVDLAQSIADLLQGVGHDASCVSTGEDALDALGADSFDIALLDLKLPGISGMQVFRRILREHSSCRTIMMSGYRLPQMISEVITGGPVEVLDSRHAMNDVPLRLANIKDGGIVLMVQDEPRFAESLARYLGREGHTPAVIYRRQDVQQQLKSGKADVLILDLRQPVLYALDCYLHTLEQGRRIPTVLISTTQKNLPYRDVFRSFENTMCLFKPFSPEVLFNTIDLLPSYGWFQSPGNTIS